VQARFIGGKNQKIIHVAHVAAQARAIFDQVVQSAQIQISKVLAGQVAEGQALAGRAGGNGMLDDLIEQGQERCILELTPQQRLQDGVVNATVNMWYGCMR
jgi:hypothetical protein